MSVYFYFLYKVGYNLKKWIYIFLIALLISGCQAVHTTDLNDMIAHMEKKDKISVIYSEMLTENHCILFFVKDFKEENQLLGYLILENKNGWSIVHQGASPPISSHEGLTYDAINIPYLQTGLIYGVVINPNITKINVNDRYSSNVIHTETGLGIWFNFMSADEFNVPGMKIVATSVNGDTLYQFPK